MIKCGIAVSNGYITSKGAKTSRPLRHRPTRGKCHPSTSCSNKQKNTCFGKINVKNIFISDKYKAGCDL